MAGLKTKPRDGDVEAFIAAIADEQRQRDARVIDHLMARVTKRPGVLWGTSMVGYDSYDYAYASGRTGTWYIVGWAARKTQITLYLPGGYEGYTDLLAKLGPYNGGKSCLHLKNLDSIDMAVLRTLVATSVKHVKATNPTA